MKYLRFKGRVAGAARCGLGGILLALAAAGCPGAVDPSLWPPGTGNTSGNPGSGGTGMAVCDPTPIFAAKLCANLGCHDSFATSANFDMTSTGWQTRLVGVNPKGGGANPSKCAGNGPYLATDKKPATGLFLDKLKPDAGAPCGVPMPQIGTPLSAEEFDCVQSWATALVIAGPSPTGAAGTTGGGGTSGAAGTSGGGGTTGGGGRGGTGGTGTGGARGGTGGGGGARGGTGGSSGGHGGNTDGGGQ